MSKKKTVGIAVVAGALALIGNGLIAPAGLKIPVTHGQSFSHNLGRDTVDITGKRAIALIVVDGKVILADTMTAPNQGRQVLHTKYTIVSSK
jgi:hypothetical protein